MWIRRLLPWRLCFFQMVRRHGLEHLRGIVDHRVTEFVKVRKSPEDLPRVIGRGLCDLSSRRIRWGLCVLRFKYLAAPTRCTTETAIGTGLPNHCLHQANWFYFLNLFISLFMCWWTRSLMCEDIDWRLSLFPQSYFFSYLVFSLLILFSRYLYSVLLFISSWWLCCCSIMLILEYLLRC